MTTTHQTLITFGPFSCPKGQIISSTSFQNVNHMRLYYNYMDFRTSITSQSNPNHLSLTYQQFWCYLTLSSTLLDQNLVLQFTSCLVFWCRSGVEANIEREKIKIFFVGQRYGVGPTYDKKNSTVRFQIIIGVFLVIKG